MSQQIINYQHVTDRLTNISNKIAKCNPLILEGTLTRSIGFTLEGKGFKAPIGTMCRIKSENGFVVEAIVTGFKGDIFFLMPITDIQGLELGSRIVSTGEKVKVPVGEALLGRIISGTGAPLDDRGVIKNVEYRSLHAEPINPLRRNPILKPLDVGIRSINGLLTIGQGQRIGLFAGSGVGKSVLLGMMARFTQADVIVVSLIGERGREVRDFIDNNLGEDGLKRSVVVTSPADYSPVLRLHGAWMAMTIAEYFRDQGKQVLLLMDSLTRFAQAQREIALAMGEPPATKGYPPSVFGLLPQLVERAGRKSADGSITGIFTVLAEGDDQTDPIVDSARAILDGHIVLSRHYADLGHYPAIDIEASVSRVMSQVVDAQQIEAARIFKRYHAVYKENHDLVNIGAYSPGANSDLDFAVNNIDRFNNFLQQGVHQQVTFNQSVEALYPLIHSKPPVVSKELTVK
jgi:flagellum-specific ATP synthase